VATVYLCKGGERAVIEIDESYTADSFPSEGVKIAVEISKDVKAFVLNDLGRMHESASKSANVLLQNGFAKGKEVRLLLKRTLLRLP
jgi:hypothetical protein